MEVSAAYLQSLGGLMRNEFGEISSSFHISTLTSTRNERGKMGCTREMSKQANHEVTVKFGVTFGLT